MSVASLTSYTGLHEQALPLGQLAAAQEVRRSAVTIRRSMGAQAVAPVVGAKETT
jgi:hypothetical protein